MPVAPDPIPSNLLKDCDGILQRSVVTTEVIIDRMDHAETGLLQCGAQIKGIQRWERNRLAQ